MNFTKMNGAGNDFVVVDGRKGVSPLSTAEIARVCDRHRGVGADGVLVVESAQGDADFRMRYFNADGGEAEMCGNGARCFARFARRLMPGQPDHIRFETQAGVVTAGFVGDNVALRMSDPHSGREPFELLFSGHRLPVSFLNTGVPHAVIFVPDVEAIDVVATGRIIRHHEAFAPAGTNVNFVQVLELGHLRVRTYERGVEDETLACGTGVCAAALLHMAASDHSGEVAVEVRGGDTLRVSCTRGVGGFRNVTLTGPADFVFEGEISL